MSNVSNAAAAEAVEAQTADAIASAVAACPAVAELHGGGGLHRVATYLPGRRISGVRVGEDRVAVSVVGIQGIPVSLLADQIRSAVAPLAPGRPVDIHVADLQTLDQQAPALPPGTSA